MNIKIAYSTNSNLESATQEIVKQFKDFDAKLIVFFASSNYDSSRICGFLQSGAPNSRIIGCTTAGEIISGKLLKNSIVAMALNSKIIEDVEIAVIENIGSENRIKSAFARFENHFKTAMSQFDFQKYVGIILFDGLSGAEERIMDSIGDLTNVTFIGGSAGDDLKFKQTMVFADGKAYSNAAVAALIKSGVKFDIIKTQSFCALNKELIATKVNEKSRQVLEFNNMPASQAYAAAINVSLSEAANYFMHHPVGLMINGEPYVRSPQRIDGDSIYFYCNVLQGMQLSVLESTDIIKDTKAAVDAKVKELGGISGLINFHCILRTLELEQKNLTKAYCDIFSDIPTIGFSTYGEAYIGHINQTSTILVFK